MKLSILTMLLITISLNGHASISNLTHVNTPDTNSRSYRFGLRLRPLGLLAIAPSDGESYFIGLNAAYRLNNRQTLESGMLLIQDGTSNYKIFTADWRTFFGKSRTSKGYLKGFFIGPYVKAVSMRLYSIRKSAAAGGVLLGAQAQFGRLLICQEAGMGLISGRQSLNLVQLLAPFDFRMAFSIGLVIF